MGKVEGVLLTCDRCGKSVFLKKLGERERDGGFTRWQEHESVPDGWKYSCDLGSWLCSKCNTEYEKIKEEFKSKVDAWKDSSDETD